MKTQSIVNTDPAVIDVIVLLQLPVITNLRNPVLKPRHWELIQQIFGYHFTEEEPLTLGLLNKIDAFDHTEAIEEVRAGI